MTTGYQAIWLSSDSVGIGADIGEYELQISEVSVQSLLHMATTTIRLEADVGSHVRLHFSLGTAATLAATTSVETPGSALSELERSALATTTNDLDQMLEERIHTPTLGMGMAYRF